jgi:hypothetical protein
MFSQELKKDLTYGYDLLVASIQQHTTLLESHSIYSFLF